MKHGRLRAVLKVPAVILGLALLLARAPRLLAAGANNLAARALLVEWQPVSQEVGYPRCEARLGRSGADPYLEQARRWDASQERVLLNGGRAAWLRGDCAGAREMWARAALAAPGDPIAALWLVLSATTEAAAPVRGPMAGSLARYFYLAGERARSADREAASEWYRRSLALSPNRDAAGQLAALAGQQEGPAGAVAVWQWLAQALPPGDADHWWALGQAAELRQAWEEAAYAYAQGAALASAPYGFWMRQAAVLVRLERVHEQEAAYQRAILACPDCLAPYLDLGHLWRQQGQHQGALGWYAEAQRVAPGDARPPYYRAQVLYEMGERREAEAALARAVALHRGQPWQWAVQLGDWRLGDGDRQGALDAYRQALAWKPGEAAIEDRIRQAAVQ